MGNKEDAAYADLLSSRFPDVSADLGSMVRSVFRRSPPLPKQIAKLEVVKSNGTDKQLGSTLSNLLSLLTWLTEGIVSTEQS